MSDLVKRLRNEAEVERHYDDFKFNTLSEAADRIEQLEAELATARKAEAANDLLANGWREKYDDLARTAVAETCRLAREAGEAKGKLEVSEMVGVVDGWIERCKMLEAALGSLPEPHEYLGPVDLRVMRSYIDALRTWKHTHRAALGENGR